MSHDYYQYDDHHYHDILPNLQKMLLKYNITQEELLSVKNTMLQTLASNFYDTIEQNYHFYHNIKNAHLRHTLCAHLEMTQNVIISWEFALDNMPIFTHNQINKPKKN